MTEQQEKSNEAVFIKVSNISNLIKDEVLKRFFNYIGQVDQFRLFQNPTVTDGTQQCLLNFQNPSDGQVALHLNGTKIADKALMIVHFKPSVYLTSSVILSILKNPLSTPSVLEEDPEKATALAKTVYVGNLPMEFGQEEILELFRPCGQINFMKFVEQPQQPAMPNAFQAQVQQPTSRTVFMEFNEVEEAEKALGMNGAQVLDKTIKVNYSKGPINKTNISQQPKQFQQQQQQQQIQRQQLQQQQQQLQPQPQSDHNKRLAEEDERSVYSGRHRSHSRRDSSRRRRSRSRSYDRRRHRHRHRSRSTSRRRRRRDSRERSRSPDRERRKRRSPEDDYYRNERRDYRYRDYY